MLRAHLFLFLALFWIVSGKSCQGDDLEPGSDVRVGTIVKKKCDQINRSKPGQWLRVQYTTKLYSTCEVFYDSRKALGEIAGYVYSLGSREISPAFNFGTNNMCVGEKRRISVPAGMGRWANMMDSGFVVPPNATLTHEVELLDISDAEDVPKGERELGGLTRGRASEGYLRGSDLLIMSPSLVAPSPDFIDNTIKDPETTKRLVNDDTQVGMIKVRQNEGRVKSRGS